MRPSDLTGAHGGAWNVSHVPRMSEAEQCCKAAWVVDLPGQHPVWRCYLLAVIALEDIPGVPPAHRCYDGAEWELALYALDPDSGPNPEDYWSWRPLLPANVVVQFDGCDEDRAVEVCSLTAQALVGGVLPAEPDDYVGSRQLWSDRVKATAGCRR